jgi:hypothetical protein
VAYFLFCGLLVLAVVPAFTPRWSWFVFTTVLFLAVAGLSTWLFVREVAVATSGEGPAVFGFVVYAWVVAGLFLGSCCLRLIFIMVMTVLRRLAPTPQSLFAATAPRSSTSSSSAD